MAENSVHLEEPSGALSHLPGLVLLKEHCVTHGLYPGCTVTRERKGPLPTRIKYFRQAELGELQADPGPRDLEGSSVLRPRISLCFSKIV